tara:strand:- start:320 stop:991 length:672 start_codon:yes stop_codon:yes gene_type:complete
MLQRKSNKIIFYFFLLFFVSSINNFKLNQLKFEKIKEIKISGLEYSDKQIIFDQIKKLYLENIYSLNKDELKKIFTSNTIVEKYEIFKIYPSTLLINIQKTNFLAKINYDEKVFLVGSNGKLSKEKLLNLKLPYIFGKPNIEEFLNFKRIIDESKISYNQIKNIYYFQSGRWDLELENNNLVKLPKENIIDSLNNYFEFIKYNNFLDNKIVDMRIDSQIIIND